MSLTKEQRDKLPSSDFAVPEKRALPIHDETHTRMAWNMVDKTKDLTPEERSHAKKNILNRAKKLGIDISNWDVDAIGDNEFKEEDNFDEIGPVRGQKEIITAFQFNAMALSFPIDQKDHPNKIPFSGILTRLDEPSDNAIGGSNGKRVLIPKEVGEKALPTLLAMGIDFTDDLDAHDSQKKIGLITEATIEGNAILIKGFFYGADFPTEVKRIQAEKSRLGFSYEAQVKIRSLDDDPLLITSCVFTGAAVLYKDKAGYTTTALNAKAEKLKMSEEILNLIKEMNEKFDKKFTSIEASVKDMKVSASGIMDRVRPHVDALRACADAMYAAGIGTDTSNGHAMAARKIADHMEAEAASGKLPHVYYTNDYMSASKNEQNKEENKEVMQLKELVASLETKITDLSKQKFEASEQPERKTVSKTGEISIATKRLLEKIDIQASSDKKINVYKLDEALNKLSKSLTNPQRIAIKNELFNAGVIAAN